MQCNLKAARRRASRSGLILAKFVLYACAETAIFELPFKILTLPLDLATGYPIWCRYFGDRWIEERLACLDLDTLEYRRIKHDKIMHNLTLWPLYSSNSMYKWFLHLQLSFVVQRQAARLYRTHGWSCATRRRQRDSITPFIDPEVARIY